MRAKAIAIFGGAVLMFGLCISVCAGTAAKETKEQKGASTIETNRRQAPAFDEGNIVLTFGAMADAHIMAKDPRASSEDLMKSMGKEDIQEKGDIATLGATVFETNSYMEKGLAYLEDEAGGDMDCFVFPGDLTNTGSKDDAKKFYEIYNKALDNPEMPLLYSTGNHDQLAEGGGEGEYLREVFDDAVFSADLVSDGPGYSRHSVVNGIHFIELDGSDYEIGGILYSRDVHEFLRESLKAAAKDAPDQPIFVVAHTSIPGTVAGSNVIQPDFPTLIWSTDELRECLAAYPQVVMLTGHTHYSQNSDRTIFQDDFTMVNVGPMQYMLTDYGFYNLGEGSSALPEEYDKHPQAMLFEVDRNGTVRLRRYDVGQLKQQGETWYIKAPGYEDSLADFGSNRAAKAGPVFENKELEKKVKGDSVSLCFSKASGGESQVYYYWLVVKDEKGKTVMERKYHTDLYSVPQESDMRDEWEIELEGLKSGKYTASITACNVWHALGDTIETEVEIP